MISLIFLRGFSSFSHPGSQLNGHFLHFLKVINKKVILKVINDMNDMTNLILI